MVAKAVVGPLRKRRSHRLRPAALVHQALGSRVQLIELLGDDRSDHLEVDTEVLVRDQVAEADDLRPRDLRSASAGLLGDLCCSFTDHDEVVEDRIACLPVERAGLDVTAIVAIASRMSPRRKSSRRLKEERPLLGLLLERPPGAFGE